MDTRYERLLWLAWVARRLGVTQGFTQAMWESGGRPPGTGPVGHALQTAAALRWFSLEGLWCWNVPGQDYPKHLVQEPLCQVQHRVWDCLRCHAACQLEVRHPVTFWSLGDGADGPACRAAMRVASTELDKSLLPRLMAAALWTAARVSDHRMQTHSACPHCGAEHEDEVHVMWQCPEWEPARETWCPWLREGAATLPQLGPPYKWPASLRRVGLFPLRLA